MRFSFYLKKKRKKVSHKQKENQENDDDPDEEGLRNLAYPLKKEIRKRGRPRKYFHTRKYYIKKTYHP